jgi:hypothetical protein
MDKGGKYLSAICYEMISLKLIVFLIFSTMSSLPSNPFASQQLPNGNCSTFN